MVWARRRESNSRLGGHGQAPASRCGLKHREGVSEECPQNAGGAHPWETRRRRSLSLFHERQKGGWQF